MDRYAVIWTRYTGTPRKLANIALTDTEMRITKTDEALHDRIPGISVLHDRANVPTLVYENDLFGGLPPQLEDLLPPRVRNNMQRTILSRLLAQTVNVTGMPIRLQEWELLLFAGRDGIGHLDVFRDDDTARQYYENRAAGTTSLDSASSLWSAVRSLSAQLVDQDMNPDALCAIIGPTPAVSGFVPKLLAPLTIAGEKGTIPGLVKVESELYPGMLALEDLCYALHERAGLVIPRRWLRRISAKGSEFHVLASERFDRDSEGRPLPLESAYSILRTGSPSKFPSTTSASMEMLWRAIEITSSNPVEDRLSLFKRFVLSFITGNGDLHLENWAMLTTPRGTRLSPVFDPAPMRAFRDFRRNHDLLSALEFSGIGGTGEAAYNDYAQSGKTPADLRERLEAFGLAMGLKRVSIRRETDAMLALAPEYREQAADILHALPERDRSGVSPDVPGFLTLLDDIRKALTPLSGK